MKGNFWKLLGIWIVAIIVVNPLGDFPLNDDWAYGQNVFNVVKEGNWIFEDWLAMTLIAQVVWGTAFCKLFGVSFTILRISTLVLGFLGIWGTYQCFLEVGKRERWAFFGALLIAFNPWYFSLAFTFMTDVPFYCCLIWSFYFFLIALRTDRIPTILWGTFFAILATLIRQFGLLTPLAFGIAYFLKKRDGKALIIAAIPLLTTYSIMTLYIKCLEMARGLSPGFGRLSLFIERLLNHFSVATVLERSGQLLFYWGLFLLPLLLWNISKLKQLPFKRIVIFLIISLLSIYFFFIPAWGQIPTGNIFYNLGLGPKVLKDAYFKINLSPVLSSGAWAVFKILGFGTALFFVQQVSSKFLLLKRKQIVTPANWDWVKIFAAGIILPYTIFLLVDYYFWDRYFLLPLPFWVILLTSNSSNSSKWGRGMGVIFFIGLALFSITATHDYLAWNRARWKALDKLTNESTNQRITQQSYQPSSAKAGINQIDGGFEFNVWKNTNQRKRNPISKNGKAWWFVEDDKYVISFGPLDCYELEEKYAYTHFLPPGKKEIFVLKRNPFQRQDTILCNAETLTIDRSNFISNDVTIFFGNGERQDSSKVFLGNFAIKLTQDQAFGLTTHFRNITPCERFAISIRRFDPFKTSGIVLSASNPEQFYEFQREATEQDTSGWDLLKYELTIPINYPDSTLQFYLWNPSGHEAWFDELEIVRKGSD